AGTGVEGHNSFGGGAGRNGSQVSDATDILHDAAETAMPEHYVVEIRNQRSAFAACGHVSGPEVGNNRHAKSGSDDCTFSGLPGARHRTAKIRDRRSLVINRLTVATHQFTFQ